MQLSKKDLRSKVNRRMPEPDNMVTIIAVRKISKFYNGNIHKGKKKFVLNTVSVENGNKDLRKGESAKRLDNLKSFQAMCNWLKEWKWMGERCVDTAAHHFGAILDR